MIHQLFIICLISETYVAIYKGKMIIFQPTGTNNEWHAYELTDKQIKSKQVPTDVLKQMLKDGVITKAQYNKWH